MRARLATLLTVIGAVTILLLAGNGVALATTGHGLVLGAHNSTAKQTSLARTKSGPVLGLHSKSSSNPPLAVNGRGRVANLNADLLDGFDSSRLANQPYVIKKFITTPVTEFNIDAPVPPGTYLVDYSVFLATSPSMPIGDVDCYVVQLNGPGTDRFSGEDLATTTDTSAGVSGSGVATKLTSAGLIRLRCVVPHLVISGQTDEQPIQMILTPIDKSRALSARVSHSGARTSK